MLFTVNTLIKQIISILYLKLQSILHVFHCRYVESSTLWVKTFQYVTFIHCMSGFGDSYGGGGVSVDTTHSTFYVRDCAKLFKSFHVDEHLQLFKSILF